VLQVESQTLCSLLVILVHLMDGVLVVLLSLNIGIEETAIDAII
jgi:hypothetical protein